MNRDIIVIGASAGGIEALKRLVRDFPPDLPASIFVTLHLATRTESVIPEILRTHGPLSACHPQDGEPIRPGQIYVAPPDYHLLLAQDRIRLGHGPKENLQRPCINVMFRSAAAAFGPRVVGVVLTGLLDDGAAGLWEIQQKGGLTVVQDPSEAAFRSMPESAIRGFDVDCVLSLANMASVLARQTQGFKQAGATTVNEESLEPSSQSCPLCGGVVQRATFGRMREYRCHTGHRFGTQTMVAEKTSTLERATYGALAQAEELVLLLEEASGDPAHVSDDLEAEIELRKNQVDELRRFLEHHRATQAGTLSLR